ncbi:hypothetical protein [Vibrio owensii]|uniref:hypothetical protein n=1 Tax=Vibrio owensii TaxID=696485 RepID=UPI003DA13BF6
MKIIAFFKKWRKAYLEDKGNRLHAEAQLSCESTRRNSDSLKYHLGSLLSASAKATEEVIEEKRYY